MQLPQSHISTIEQAAKKWLRSNNASLTRAIDKTVKEGLFSFEDIKHQILVLKENIEAGHIQEWAKRAGISNSTHAKGKKILCLHAGNLPLVGFQTAIGTLLSKADYYGKLSRKDPYLLASFLEVLKNTNLGQEVEFSTDLNDFQNLKADKVIFAGSRESVPTVKNEIHKIKAAREHAQYIIRTAKFSIAYIEDLKPDTLKKLVEAAFRYGGKGCRSVAMVVTKFPLDTDKSDITDRIKSFWLQNPQHLKPDPNLHYQFAYNNAIGRSQIWLEDFLIQKSEEFPETEFCLNWMQGDVNNVKALIERFGNRVQSVYTDGIKIDEVDTEVLSQAQSPPLWWKPDGMDIIESIIHS